MGFRQVFRGPPRLNLVSPSKKESPIDTSGTQLSHGLGFFAVGCVPQEFYGRTKLNSWPTDRDVKTDRQYYLPCYCYSSNCVSNIDNLSHYVSTPFWRKNRTHILVHAESGRHRWSQPPLTHARYWNQYYSAADNSWQNVICEYTSDPSIATFAGLSWVSEMALSTSMTQRTGAQYQCVWNKFNINMSL